MSTEFRYVNFEIFKEINDKSTSIKKIKVEKVVDKDFVIVSGESDKVEIATLMNDVCNNNLKITNPSVLKSWNGFKIADSNIEARDRFIKEIKEFNTTLTYKFELGEEVRVGAWKNPKVVEIIENGLCYRVRGQVTTRNGGSLTENFFAWYQLRPTNNNTESLVAKEELPRLYYSQREVNSLLTNIYAFGVDYNPTYQRGLVWTQEDKELLIDSIFHGVDIGKFVFVKKPFGGYGSFGYEILDGKQRLHTIQEFYENRFAYKGKYFNDLSRSDQDYFTYYNVSYADIEETITDKQKYLLFVRLNTCGKSVDTKQIEKVKFMLKETK